MTVLYITFIDFLSNATSGSSVRPKMMYQAFIDIGLKVKPLSGQTGIGFRSQRLKQVREINKWLDTNKPDFCYVENSTYPIMNNCDIRLLKRIHSMKIPIGYFFRDVYYKFKDEFPGRTGILNRLKDTVLSYMYMRDEKVIKHNVDIVYFPTEAYGEKFDFGNKVALPPAGSNYVNLEKKPGKTCIYVGGIIGHYDLNTLLESFDLLHKKNKDYKLILVCRENEYKSVNTIDYPWIEVHHVSSDDVAPLYRRSDIGLLIPSGNYKYNRIAISVKLYEYMSYGLPVVTTKGKAMENIINHYNIGIMANNSKEYANAIERILENNDLYRQYCNNVYKALVGENLWTHRAEKVKNDLLGGKL